MEKQQAIHFEDYDKISDTILWFSSEIFLRFTVSLAGKAQDGTRRSNHQEFAYESKYDNVAVSRSIRREINCYLSIEVKNDFYNSALIRYQNMIMLKLKMDNVVQWFTTLFSIEDDKLAIVGNYKNEQVHLDYGKVLEFEPIVLQFDDGTFCEGIRMYVNSRDTYVDMPIDKFMAFYYIIEKFDMYQNAIILLNYIQRPDFGYNTFAMTNMSEEELFARHGRYKKPKYDGDGSNSFFNKK